MKIFPVEAELFHVEDRWTDGRIDMTNLIVAFRNLANTPKTLIRTSIQKNTPARIWVIMRGQLNQTVKHATLFLV